MTCRALRLLINPAPAITIRASLVGLFGEGLHVDHGSGVFGEQRHRSATFARFALRHRHLRFPLHQNPVRKIRQSPIGGG